MKQWEKPEVAAIDINETESVKMPMPMLLITSSEVIEDES
jgi:hypothetical protein